MRERAWKTDMRKMCKTAQRLSTQGARSKETETGEAHVSPTPLHAGALQRRYIPRAIDRAVPVPLRCSRSRTDLLLLSALVPSRTE